MNDSAMSQNIFLTPTNRETMAVTTKIENLSFQMGDTSFSASIVKYELLEKLSTPYVVAIRLVQNGKSTVKHVTSYDTKNEALMAYGKSLQAMDITEYGIIIHNILDLHLKKRLKKFKDSDLDGFEGNMVENLEVCEQMLNQKNN